MLKSRRGQEGADPLKTAILFKPKELVRRRVPSCLLDVELINDNKQGGVMKPFAMKEMLSQRTATVDDIMRWTGVTRQAVFHRARKGDFKRWGKDGRNTMFLLEDTAKAIIIGMSTSRAKNAGRPPVKRNGGGA